MFVGQFVFGYSIPHTGFVGRLLNKFIKSCGNAVITRFTLRPTDLCLRWTVALHWTLNDLYSNVNRAHERRGREEVPSTACTRAQLMLVFCPRWVYHDVLWKMSVFWTCFRQGFPRGTSVFSFQDTSIQNPGRIISIPCVPLLATLLPF